MEREAERAGQDLPQCFTSKPDEHVQSPIGGGHRASMCHPLAYGVHTSDGTRPREATTMPPTSDQLLDPNEPVASSGETDAANLAISRQLYQDTGRRLSAAEQAASSMVQQTNLSLYQSRQEHMHPVSPSVAGPSLSHSHWNYADAAQRVPIGTSHVNFTPYGLFQPALQIAEPRFPDLNFPYQPAPTYTGEMQPLTTWSTPDHGQLPHETQVHYLTEKTETKPNPNLHTAQSTQGQMATEENARIGDQMAAVEIDQIATELEVARVAAEAEEAQVVAQGLCDSMQGPDVASTALESSQATPPPIPPSWNLQSMELPSALGQIKIKFKTKTPAKSNGPAVKKHLKIIKSRHSQATVAGRPILQVIHPTDSGRVMNIDEDKLEIWAQEWANGTSGVNDLCPPEQRPGFQWINVPESQHQTSSGTSKSASKPSTPRNKPPKETSSSTKSKRTKRSSTPNETTSSGGRTKKPYTRVKPPEQLMEEAVIEQQHPNATKGQLRSLKLRALYAWRIAEREKDMSEEEKARRRRLREYIRTKREAERAEQGLPQLLIGKNDEDIDAVVPAGFRASMSQLVQPEASSSENTVPPNSNEEEMARAAAVQLASWGAQAAAVGKPDPADQQINERLYQEAEMVGLAEIQTATGRLQAETSMPSDYELNRRLCEELGIPHPLESETHTDSTAALGPTPSATTSSLAHF